MHHIERCKDGGNLEKEIGNQGSENQQAELRNLALIIIHEGTLHPV
jgi:hypothetical protein